MSTIQIDWTALVAIWMVAVVVMIPVIGVTARFSVIPIVGALAHYRERTLPHSVAADPRLAEVERRLALLERWAAADRLGGGSDGASIHGLPWETGGNVPRGLEVEGGHTEGQP